MSNFDAVTDAVELMRVWSDDGAAAANDRISSLPEERREDLLVGLVNLLGAALCVREGEQGVSPTTTLGELVGQPWN